MGIFDKAKRAYTLAEVIIVLVIISIVVSVTMRVAKMRLDNITSYTYYHAYDLLNDMAAQMVAGYDPQQDRYMEVARVPSSYSNLFLFSRRFVWTGVGLPVCARECEFTTNATITPSASIDSSFAESFSNSYGIPLAQVQRCLRPGEPSCPSGGTLSLNVSTCTWQCKTKTECSTGDGDYCPNGLRKFPGRPCDCGEGGTYNEATNECECSGGRVYKQGQGCVCPDGTTWDPGTASCKSNSGEVCNVPSDAQQQIDYCAHGYKDFVEASCDYAVKPAKWPDCPVGQHWNPVVPGCGCVPDNATVPRKGANFCEMFVSFVNTKTGESLCSGGAVATNVTDFSGITPDIVLRNGMRVFNASQNPANISEFTLANGEHKNSFFTKDDGTKIYLDEFGYTLYIDIDGARNGNSKLWEDIFPFYVTLSGKVVPAYKTTDISGFGGGSRYYLQTSILVDSVNADGSNSYWLAGSKSVAYRESACRSGYVSEKTNYCKRNPKIEQHNTCKDERNSCTIKKVNPIKWL